MNKYSKILLIMGNATLFWFIAYLTYIYWFYTKDFNIKMYAFYQNINPLYAFFIIFLVIVLSVAFKKIFNK